MGLNAFTITRAGRAKNIEAEVKAIGQNSRGCKIRLNSGGTDYYGFIRETACPAVIVEGCFVDNTSDVQIADSIEEQKAFGVAYAKGSREPRHASRATFSFFKRRAFCPRFLFLSKQLVFYS